MNRYLLPRRPALYDAIGAEQYTLLAGFELRNYLII
jgi:hypothetical protein